LLNSFSRSVSMTIDEMTKKLTGKTLTGISRSLASLPKTPLDTLSASVAMPHLCADSAAESTRVEKRRRTSHNHFRLLIREVGIVLTRSCPLAADGAREAQWAIQDVVPVSRSPTS
jgi:hypothetical protein